MAAVNASLRRISGVLSALTRVWTTPPARPSALGRSAAAAGRFDLLARGAREAVGAHGQPLRQLALGEDLDRDALARGEPGRGQGRGRHLGAVLEAPIEVAHVDRLGPRAELLERHRLLHVRAAALAQAHVDRHLAALEAASHLAARARARALLAAAGRLAVARALAAADALAPVARPGRRAQRVKADLLGVHA